MSIPSEAIEAAQEAFAKIYNNPVTMAACITAAVEAAQPYLIAAEQETSDRQFLDNLGFEQRLKALMRRNPKLLENWIRQRNRIYGGQRWLSA